MLGTAEVLGCDILVYWRYSNGKGWIRYPVQERGPSRRAAFLFHVIHSEKAQLFHCEPLVKWPIERLISSMILTQCTRGYFAL